MVIECPEYGVLPLPGLVSLNPGLLVLMSRDSVLLGLRLVSGDLVLKELRSLILVLSILLCRELVLVELWSLEVILIGLGCLDPFGDVSEF